MIAEELVADAVELVGRDTRNDVPTDLIERLGGQPAGHPHARDRVGVLDLGLAALVPVSLADIVGAFDVRRDAAMSGLYSRA